MHKIRLALLLLCVLATPVAQSNQNATAFEQRATLKLGTLPSARLCTYLALSGGIALAAHTMPYTVSDTSQKPTKRKQYRIIGTAAFGALGAGLTYWSLKNQRSEQQRYLWMPGLALMYSALYGAKQYFSLTALPHHLPPEKQPLVRPAVETVVKPAPANTSATNTATRVTAPIAHTPAILQPKTAQVNDRNQATQQSQASNAFVASQQAPQPHVPAVAEPTETHSTTRANTDTKPNTSQPLVEPAPVAPTPAIFTPAQMDGGGQETQHPKASNALPVTQVNVAAQQAPQTHAPAAQKPIATHSTRTSKGTTDCKTQLTMNIIKKLQESWENYNKSITLSDDIWRLVASTQTKIVDTQKIATLQHNLTTKTNALHDAWEQALHLIHNNNNTQFSETLDSVLTSPTQSAKEKLHTQLMQLQTSQYTTTVQSINKFHDQVTKNLQSFNTLLKDIQSIIDTAPDRPKTDASEKSKSPEEQGKINALIDQIITANTETWKTAWTKHSITQKKQTHKDWIPLTDAWLAVSHVACNAWQDAWDNAWDTVDNEDANGKRTNKMEPGVKVLHNNNNTLKEALANEQDPSKLATLLTTLQQSTAQYKNIITKEKLIIEIIDENIVNWRTAQTKSTIIKESARQEAQKIVEQAWKKNTPETTFNLWDDATNEADIATWDKHFKRDIPQGVTTLKEYNLTLKKSLRNVDTEKLTALLQAIQESTAAYNAAPIRQKKPKTLEKENQPMSLWVRLSQLIDQDSTMNPSQRVTNIINTQRDLIAEAFAIPKGALRDNQSLREQRRRLALALHPDKNNHTLEAQKAFDTMWTIHQALQKINASTVK